MVSLQTGSPAGTEQLQASNWRQTRSGANVTTRNRNKFSEHWPLSCKNVVIQGHNTTTHVSVRWITTSKIKEFLSRISKCILIIIIPIWHWPIFIFYTGLIFLQLYFCTIHTFITVSLTVTETSIIKIAFFINLKFVNRIRRRSFIISYKIIQ